MKTADILWAIVEGNWSLTHLFYDLDLYEDFKALEASSNQWDLTARTQNGYTLTFKMAGTDVMDLMDIVDPYGRHSDDLNIPDGMYDKLDYLLYTGILHTFGEVE